MPETSGAITLYAALLAGAAGSAHCLVMCGGLAGALGMRTAGGSSAALSSVLYHGGRLIGYAAAGAAFGFAGASIQSAIDLPALSSAARFAAGLLVILAAVKVVSNWNPLAAIERWGARYWRALQPLVRHAVNVSGPTRSLLLGLLWGWLPCGLVYSMLLFAALSGDALKGGGIMLAFGLGTLPSMVAGSAFASQLSSFMRRRGARRLSGIALLLFGVWLASASLPTAPHHVHPAADSRAPIAK